MVPQFQPIPFLPLPTVPCDTTSQLSSTMALISGFSTISLRNSSRGVLSFDADARRIKCNHKKHPWHRRSTAGITGIRAQVSFVDGEEAKKLVTEQGYTVVDVRDKTQYERAHIASSVHVPLFIDNTDNDFGTILKRQAHNNFAGLFYGLAFTKPNPDFVKSVKEKFPTDSKLLLVCQEGLRSTAAANTLEEVGYKNVSCITSGLQSIKPGTFEAVGKTELQNAGKAGLVTIQGKISAVLGTVLICAFLFITFFPEQAEQLLKFSPNS